MTPSKWGRDAGPTRVLQTALGLGIALVLTSCPPCRLAAQTKANPGPPVPSIQTKALDGHTVSLPDALPGRATVLILGFGKHSAEATTAWEKPVRTQLAHPLSAFMTWPWSPRCLLL